MKQVFAVACLLLVATSAWAGDQGMKQMEMMKAEMSKCDVCKHMVPYLDQIGPVQSEVVQMNDGMAIIHTASPDKADLFHKAGDECSAAGMKAMELTDEQAKTHLCSMCQGIRSAVKAGATMSQGMTKNGDIMVLTSQDSKVQMQLSQLGEKCAMMMGQDQAKR
jgi:hypothetical protein